MSPETIQDLADYRLLKFEIEMNLKVYREILQDNEEGLKQYLKVGISQTIIEFQKELIIGYKAKVSALEDLTN